MTLYSDIRLCIACCVNLCTFYTNHTTIPVFIPFVSMHNKAKIVHSCVESFSVSIELCFYVILSTWINTQVLVNERITTKVMKIYQGCGFTEKVD